MIRVMLLTRGVFGVIYTIRSNLQLRAIHGPYSANCDKPQIFEIGVKKRKITLEDDFSSFPRNRATP